MVLPLYAWDECYGSGHDDTSSQKARRWLRSDKVRLETAFQVAFTGIDELGLARIGPLFPSSARSDYIALA